MFEDQTLRVAGVQLGYFVHGCILRSARMPKLPKALLTSDTGSVSSDIIYRFLTPPRFSDLVSTLCLAD